MLQKIGFVPGFNKQITSTGAENRWTGGENVRFRYGTPEKIGGWSQLGVSKLTGVARAQHHMVSNASVNYSIIGTNRILYAYTGGIFYDIHPLVNPTGTTLTSAFSTTNGSPTVTITFPGTHSFLAGDIILFSDFSTITNSNYSATDFDGKKFMVTSVPTSTTITITMASAETGSGATTSGGIKYYQYYHVGPAEQLGAFGWGIALWGGNLLGALTFTLDGALGDNTSGNNGSATQIRLNSVAGLTSTGTNFIQIGSEEISYTGINGNELTGITRAVRGTTRAAHNTGVTVTNTSSFTGWGSPAANTDSVTDPGLWSLDNLGGTAIALIHNGECFEWDANATNATENRATIIAGAPTASRDMLVSTPDRHLVFFGTETIIGDKTSQDEMFIRFSSQENINDYVPTAINSAGSQRLADGSRIMGAKLGRNALYVWTNSAMFTMRFVGTPFTFAFEQVGTNCGLLGMNAAVEVDGTAYWMSDNGFFRYTGQLQSMQCLVEDYVYEDINTTSNQLVYAGINNLFGEITWFYPTSTSNVNNRCVVYNYLDSTQETSIWSTNASSLFTRTTWEDSSVFGLPHATQYNAADDASFDVVGNTEGSTIYFEHETGFDQISASATSAIPSSITSGDYDITQDQREGVSFRGDGEFMMRISRIIPDFVSQSEDVIIKLDLRDYPNDAATTQTYTSTPTTNFIDTRARARQIALTISNTAVSSNWKLGTFRLDVHSGGRR
jgi:hypothetical protein